LCDVCMLDCEMYLNPLMKRFYALAYPTFVVVCSAVWYSLLR